MGKAGTDDDTTDDAGTHDAEKEDSRIDDSRTDGASAITKRKRGKLQLSVNLNHMICLIKSR